MDNFALVEKTIKDVINDATVNIYDLGGGNHLRVEVVSSAFEGKSLVQQHKMLHDILDHQMEFNGGFIHALSMKTSKP